MGSIFDEAKSYEPKKLKNIADLDVVPTDMNVMTEEYPDINDPTKTVQIKVIEHNGEKFRIPATVFGQLKVIIGENPSLKRFKVKKMGSGLNTEYVVIPIN